jgi:hypothetical protein
MKWSVSLFGLCILLAAPGIGSAEIWRCPQENGTDLFTNEPADPDKCEKYIRSATVSPDPQPTEPAALDTLGESPTILFPYAQDGPAPPDPYIPPPPDYFPYGYDPFGYYQSYGFFGFTRPHFRFTPGIKRFSPGIKRHFGGHRPHTGMGSRHSRSGGHGRSGRR